MLALRDRLKDLMSFDSLIVGGNERIPQFAGQAQ